VAHELVGRFHSLTNVFFLSNLGVDAEVVLGELCIYLDAVLLCDPFQNKTVLVL